MKRATHLMQKRTREAGLAPDNNDGMGLFATGSLSDRGGGSFFGGGSSFGFDSGGSFGFDAGSGGALNFGQTDLSFGGSSLGFGQGSFNVNSLNNRVFGQNSPLASANTPLRSGSPDQSKVPDFDNWQEFVGFLVANGPAWVRAFQDGTINAPGGVTGSESQSDNMTPEQRQELLRQQICQRRPDLCEGSGGGGSFLSGQTGMLVLGGLALGGVLLVVLSQSDSAPVIARGR